MSIDHSITRTDPFAGLAPAVNAAHGALRDEPRRPLDAIAWLSAHLEAVAHAVLPAARTSDEERAAADAVRRDAHALYAELRWLEQLHSGDALVARLDADRQRDTVLASLDRYAGTERRLLDVLAERLESSTQLALVSAYDDALVVAPTRPHPHAPHRGLLGAIAFRIDAWRDRILNTMDARHVPTPRRSRPTAPAGKWTGYVLGGMPSETPRRESSAPGR